MQQELNHYWPIGALLMDDQLMLYSGHILVSVGIALFVML